jgi:xanthine dehydrogenase small subunit
VRAYKVAKRVDQDISTVSAAFALRVEDGRIAHVRLAYGGVAATPVRATGAEAIMLGKPWTLVTAAYARVALMSDISPMDDARGTSAYRLAVAANLLYRLWHDTADASAETPSRLEAL